jgi:hypothetical protein
MRELSCSECVELCPDVALGVADAEERATVLTHVERCRSCRGELASLSDVADLLYVLVPPVAPPRGFATRVAEGISSSSRPEPEAPSSRRRFVRPLAVAAAIVLAAAIGIAGWLAAGGGSAPSVAVQTAALISHDHRVGQVMTVPGKKPWISVAVHLTTRTTVVRCQVRGESGGWHTIGTFDVNDGRGYWVAPLPHGLTVRWAELVTTRGHVLASASLAEA